MVVFISNFMKSSTLYAASLCTLVRFETIIWPKKKYSKRHAHQTLFKITRPSSEASLYFCRACSARITRGLQADCDFALVINLSFYRFGIRSCLATSHKQVLKTPFSMTSSGILGFQATWQPTWAHFIHLLFTVRWRIVWRIVKYFWGK